MLPFEDCGGDPEQDYFADGITDDLTTDLSHIARQFRDRARYGVHLQGQARRRESDRAGTRRALALEGSVRRVGETVEVNAQLISTETGAHVWADRFEGERSRLGKLQFEVVARLANSLGVELVKAEALRAERERPNNPDAADLTMRGFATLWNFNGANKSTWNDAIALFERALALDPKNAAAMTGLAMHLFARPYGGWSDDPAGDFVRADKTADAALALRPNDSEAHLVKALLFERSSQIRAAIGEAETAIADDPNNARAIAMASYYRLFLGHAEEGVVGQETALRLSPHDPMAPIWQVHLCYLYNHLAQWEQSIEWCEKALGTTSRKEGARSPRLRPQRLGRPRRGGEEGDRGIARSRSQFHIAAREAGTNVGSDDPTYSAQSRNVLGPVTQGGTLGEVRHSEKGDKAWRCSGGLGASIDDPSVGETHLQ